MPNPTQHPLSAPTARELLQEISVSISWGDLARRYFTKSAPWFYERFNGKDNRDSPSAFTPEEIEQLRSALHDLANRIHQAADNL